MKEIAEVGGISRPGLYLYFKTKEEIFSAAVIQHADSKIDEISKNIDGKKNFEEKLWYIFEIFVIKGFDRTLKSKEAKEVSDCSLEFARDAVDESYQKLEEMITPLFKLKKFASPRKSSHLLVSAVRGFKIAAPSSSELRKMIHDLLEIVLQSK